MIAWYRWMAAVHHVFYMDPWFWNCLLFWWLARHERGWRKEVQRDRDYWRGETYDWMRQVEKLCAPVASAMKVGQPRAPHHCHDADCEVRVYHDCHESSCKLRERREVS